MGTIRKLLPIIIFNLFAVRQTKESPYSHYEGTTAELIELVSANFSHKRQIVGDDIVAVRVPHEGFFSSVIKITPEHELRTTLFTRRPGEEPFKRTTVVGGPKTPAKYVDVILYKSSKLEEQDRCSNDLDAYEIISINASPIEEPTPEDPTSMSRNALEKEGGTKREYTPEEWAKATWFWSQHAHADDSNT